MEQTFKMEKYNFNAYDGNNFCTKEFRTQINYQFIQYQEILQEILKNTHIVDFFHRSVLE